MEVESQKKIKECLNLHSTKDEDQQEDGDNNAEPFPKTKSSTLNFSERSCRCNRSWFDLGIDLKEKVSDASS